MPDELVVHLLNHGLQFLPDWLSVDLCGRASLRIQLIISLGHQRGLTYLDELLPKSEHIALPFEETQIRLLQISLGGLELLIEAWWRRESVPGLALASALLKRSLVCCLHLQFY